MRNIAIVEDEDLAAKTLLESLDRYQKENGTKFTVIRFASANDFLKDYTPIYAVVFMDIQMPGMNGMDASFALRKIDQSVSLIFITSLMQFAQKGYEVDAVGYLLKPVTYYDLSMKLTKALDIYVRNEKRNVVLGFSGGLCNISCDKLMYVEVVKHRLYYHLVDDVVETTGTLSSVEAQLESYGFLRCNNCYLVNPKFIVSVQGSNVLVGQESLLISRPRRANFIAKLTEWFASSAAKD